MPPTLGRTDERILEGRMEKEAEKRPVGVNCKGFANTTKLICGTRDSERGSKTIML